MFVRPCGAVDGVMRMSQGVAVDVLEMLYSVFTLKAGRCRMTLL